MWVVGLYLAATWCGVSTQPVSCSQDDECHEGYYCETLTQRCSEYLNCTDVKREPPTDFIQSTRVKSFVDCGPCLKGFVVDHRGVITANCVSPDSQDETPALPVYFWVLIGFIIVIVIVFFICLYLYRKTETFKVWASTSIRSLFERPSGSHCAPDSPPPYNPDAGYTYVPNLNVAYAPPQEWTHVQNEVVSPEPGRVSVKPRPARQARETHEPADSQTARVFNPPAYEYHDDESLSSPEPTDDRHDKYSPASPWMLQDEDTMQSLWTPHEHTNNDAPNNNATGVSVVASHGDETEATSEADSAASLSTALVPFEPLGSLAPLVPLAPLSTVSSLAPLVPHTHRDDASLAPPAAKRTRRQESSGNRHQDSSAGPSASSSNMNQPASDTQNSVIINISVNHTK